jgi:protein-L-isoaspartate(D-aspartate) O-methyltransferase
MAPIALLAVVLKDEYIHKGARKKLVEELEHKGIVDKEVLKAIGKVPRHFFFTKTFVTHAYADKAFPIGNGQTISQPYTVAYQTEILHVHKGDKILEIGTGSGYQAAILMEMGAKVYSIERVEALHKTAGDLLKKMGYAPHLKLGDGTKGWPEKAPFDKIIVTAGAPVVPEDLKQQLKVGGVMVIPVGDLNRQKMISILKSGPNTYKSIELEHFAFVPLLGEEGWR